MKNYKINNNKQSPKNNVQEKWVVNANNVKVYSKK